MKFQKKSIRTEKKYQNLLLIVLAVVICITAIVMGYVYINSMRKSLWQQIVLDITEVTNQGSHTFETFVEREREALDVLATNLSDYKFGTAEGKSEALRLLNLHANEKGFYSLVVYGEDNKVTVYLAGEKQPIEGGSQNDYKGYGESGITEPYINNYTGQKTLGYYRRIQFADGTKAIVRKGQLMSYITEQFSLSFYNNTGFSYIVKRNGDIIVRPTHQNSNRTGSNLFKILEYNENADDEAQTLKAALAAGNTGALLSTAGSEDRVIAFVPIYGVEDWYMISVIPNSSVAQNMEDILRSTTAIASIIAIVIITLVLFFVAVYIFQKKTEAQKIEVKYREQLFSTLANNTDEVFIMAAHGSNVADYISPNITRVLGIGEDAVKTDIYAVGKINNCGEELTADSGEVTPYGVLDKRQELSIGESVMQNTERQHRGLGELRYYREVAYCVSIDGVVKDIIIYSDRTSEKKAEMALVSAMEMTMAASKAKSAFLSSMSHDIRTPMNAILGFTELIKRDSEDPHRVLQHVSKIQASGQHLLGLINDILDVSKIESGKIVLNIQSFNFAEFISGIDSIIRPQANSKNQEFEIIANGIKEESLLGDKLRLNQVFINILSNAVKYTPEHGRIVMEIDELPRFTENFAHLRFTISDNGIGMSDEYLKVIFEPFTREKSETVNLIQGTGLGMTITKNLVDLFGGTISVKSKLGQGSTFVVDLELRIDSSDLNKEFWKDHGISHALVVDDEREACMYVKSMLENAGLVTKFALSGKSAVETVRQTLNGEDEIDLVILDLMMPNMDGVETARELRKLVKPTVPILLLTANDWSDVEQSAREAGINAFLPKPFFVSNLKHNIRLIKKEYDEKENNASPFEGKHFLVVEDNELNTEIIVELLDMRGATCDVAQNGRIAVETFTAAAAGTYDMILMDVQMPEMNGYEATKIIRASNHPEAKSIIIVAMTANAFAEDVREAMTAGMDAHVAKPISIERIEEIYKKLSSERADKKD